MRFQVEELSSTKRRLTVFLSQDEFEKERKSVINRLRKDLKIKGFRKGKVPIHIIELYLKDTIDEETTTNLINKTYQKAILDSALRPISRPFIERGDFRDKEFFYHLTFEVRPNIELKDYTNIEVSVEKKETKDEDVEIALRELQRYHAKVKDKNDEAKEGDIVFVDCAFFDGQGKEIKDLEIKGLMLELGEGGLFGHDKLIVGHKKGETIKFNMEIPKEASDTYGGKTYETQVKIKEVKEKILPDLDDNFAKEYFNFDSLSALKEKIREDIEKRREKEYRHELENKVLDKLLELHTFELPEQSLKEELDMLIEERQSFLKSQGIPEHKVSIHIGKEMENLKKQAERRLKVAFILDKIAEVENFDTTDEEIEKKIDEVAKRTGRDRESIKKDFDTNPIYAQNLKTELLREKALDFLLGRVKNDSCSNSC